MHLRTTYTPFITSTSWDLFSLFLRKSFQSAGLFVSWPTMINFSLSPLCSLSISLIDPLWYISILKLHFVLWHIFQANVKLISYQIFNNMPKSVNFLFQDGYVPWWIVHSSDDLHVFTHCDTSAFKGTGKLRPIKLLLKNKGFQDALSKLGDTWEVPAELNDKLEALREHRPPWPRQIITLILPTVNMLSLGCEKLRIHPP